MSWLDPFSVPIEKDGVILPARGKLKLGPGITATDNPDNDSTDLDAAVSITLAENDPLGLVLKQVNRQNPFNFMPAALIYVNDDMSVTSLTRFTTFSEGTPQTPTISGGQFTLVHPSGGDKNSGFQEGADIGMAQFAVSLKVTSRSGAADTNTYENVAAGAAKDSNNFVFAVWRRREGTNGTASIQVKISGSSNWRADVALSAAWTPPFEIGLSLVANSLTFWQKPNGGEWTKISSYDVTATFNFKTASLTGWKGSFLLATQSAVSCTFVLDDFKVGRFGAVGFRDPVVVSDEDGTPRFTGDTVHLTATCTDPQAAAYCGVFSLDLVTYTLTQTGLIMVTRGGACQNDNAAHIIAYDDGTYRIFMTTWGSTGAANIQILYKNETSLNLLSGANVIASMAQLTLPGLGSGGAYDPYVVKTGGVWYIAFTVGPVTVQTFYPALASSSDLVTWTAVGSDSLAFPYEGTRIVYLAGQYWVLCANVSNINVYDLSMNFYGSRLGPFLLPSGGYPPHPMLVPHGDYVYQVSFDNTLYGAVANTMGWFRELRARRNDLVF